MADPPRHTGVRSRGLSTPSGQNVILVLVELVGRAGKADLQIRGRWLVTLCMYCPCQGVRGPLMGPTNTLGITYLSSRLLQLYCLRPWECAGCIPTWEVE